MSTPRGPNMQDAFSFEGWAILGADSRSLGVLHYVRNGGSLCGKYQRRTVFPAIWLDRPFGGGPFTNLNCEACIALREQKPAIRADKDPAFAWGDEAT